MIGTQHLAPLLNGKKDSLTCFEVKPVFPLTLTSEGCDCLSENTIGIDLDIEQ